MQWGRKTPKLKRSLVPGPCLSHPWSAHPHLGLTPGRGSPVWTWFCPPDCRRRRRLPAAALSVHPGAVPEATAAPSRGQGGRSADRVCAAGRPRAGLPAAATAATAAAAPRTAPSRRGFVSSAAPTASSPAGAASAPRTASPGRAPRWSQPARCTRAPRRVLIPPASSPHARGGSLRPPRASLQEPSVLPEATGSVPPPSACPVPRRGMDKGEFAAAGRGERSSASSNGPEPDPAPRALSRPNGGPRRPGSSGGGAHG
jgi:hypothetical protein